MGSFDDTTEEFQREVLARRGQLYGAALRMTGCPAQAEDLVQEAVLRAWTFWDRFQPGTNGRAWMHRILTNTFINGYRRKRREREILGEIRRDVSAEEDWDRGVHRVPGEGLGDEVTAAWLAGGSWTAEINGADYPVAVSLKPLYDPTNARIRA